jgi:hypothetical protein
MKPLVLNRRTATPEQLEECVYIGRKSSGFHFGNPFSSKVSAYAINVSSRKESLLFFTEWLHGKHPDVESERWRWVRDNLQTLKNKNLLCFCAPKLCHGDVLLWYMEGISEDEIRKRIIGDAVESTASILDFFL